jgi:hypothetical protein
LLGAERGELHSLWFLSEGSYGKVVEVEKVATLLRELLRTHHLSLLLTVGRCGEVGLPAEVGGGGPKGRRQGGIPPRSDSFRFFISY